MSPSNDLVRIHHPETGGYADVVPSSLPVWLDSGWTVETENNNDGVDEEDPENEEVR